jgi:subtilisin family serine protease
LKEGSSVLKHYSLLTLCVLLVAGALCLSGPEAGAVNNGSGTTLHQTGPVASQVGQVMILHLSAETGPGEPYPDDIPASLARLGVERGDLLDGDNILVRVPDDELAAARMVAGSALQAYAPSARLAGQIRGQGGTVSVDVTVFQPEDKVSVALAVNRLGGTILNGETGSGSVLRLQIPEIHLESLSQLPNVVYIEPAVTYSLMNDRARDLVGAAPLSVAGWLSSLQPGLTGVGQIVGLADSGLDTGSIDDIHPDLASVPGERPKVVMLSSWAGAAVAADPDGHGTSMAATIAGTGAASSGRYQGLAPGASIYFQGLTNSSGQLDPPPDLGDLFEPAYAAGVRIHVDGWGGASGGYQDTASQTDHFIRLHPDFLVVFSAGNNGPNTGGLTPEAYSKNALVVGASQSPHPAFNPDQVDSGQVSDFSSRGPTSDGRLKPDLLAPGAVISAKARQVATEFDLGDGYYTYMEGTSMAAAVAGGSAALLREYFIKYEQQLSPTAALLKAALICGASTPVTGPSSDGFGTLDLGGTVLGLHEKTFNYVDDRSGLADGGTATYNCKVQGSGSPFKATLAWTDPSVLPGSVHPLVNNLDLVVKDPAGKLWLGNSFLTAGKPDDANNVEEVYIPQPEAGTYTVYVKGTSVVQNTVPGASQKSQDYALVYGQPLIRDVVQSVAKKVTLASGSEISLDNTLVSFEENGQIVNWPLSVVAPGATTPAPH